MSTEDIISPTWHHDHQASLAKTAHDHGIERVLYDQRCVLRALADRALDPEMRLYYEAFAAQYAVFFDGGE